MNDLLANMLESTRAYAPNLLAALAILIVGWVLAAILSRVVRASFRRLHLDEKLDRFMGTGDGERQVESGQLIGRGVYAVVMLLALVAFFQALGLTLITEPLNNMLNQVAVFLPKVLGAGALLVVAWIVATVVRLGVGGVLRGVDLDRRLSDSVAESDKPNVPVSKSLADAGYWLVFLLFLPGVISALGVTGLLGPAEDLTSRLVGFLPNLLAAGMIFVVGWFVARIVQRVVSSLLAAAGADRLADRIGIGTALGEQRLSGAIGLVLYAFILIPVLIAALNALQIDALTQPASAMLNTMLSALPALIAAMMILAVSFLIGRVVSNLVTNVLSGIGFDNVLGKLGISAKPGARTPSEVMGTIVLVAILLFAVTESLRMLGMDAVASLARDLTVFAGQVAMGVVILGAGMFVANFVGGLVRDSGTRQANAMSIFARTAVMVLTTAMALRQMGLASDIINLAFGLLLGAVAVAAAVAFGVGGRSFAERQLTQWSQELQPESGEIKTRHAQS